MEGIIQETQAKLYLDEMKMSGVTEVVVTGNSMFPFLKDKDTVMIVPAVLSDIKIGDIVLTLNEQRLLCHRVCRKTDNSFQTKADALTRPEAPLSAKGLIGRVVKIRHKKESTFVPVKFGFLILMIMQPLSYLYIPLRLLRRFFLKPFERR